MKNQLLIQFFVIKFEVLFLSVANALEGKDIILGLYIYCILLVSFSYTS